MSDVRTRILVAAAIVGQVAITASAWLLPAVSEYSLTRDSISELALGSFGWVQTAAFVLSGVGVLALAAGLRRATSGSPGSAVGSVLLAVYGLGALVCAIFPTDEYDGTPDLTAMSNVALVHVGAVLASFLSAIAAMFVLSRTFARTPGWQALRPWSLVLAFVALATLFLPSVGLTQRLMVGVVSLWVVLVALRLRAAHIRRVADVSRARSDEPEGMTTVRTNDRRTP